MIVMLAFYNNSINFVLQNYKINTSYKFKKKKYYNVEGWVN